MESFSDQLPKKEKKQMKDKRSISKLMPHCQHCQNAGQIRRSRLGKLNFIYTSESSMFSLARERCVLIFGHCNCHFPKKNNPHQHRHRHHHRYCYGHRFLSRTFDLACTGCNWFVLLFLRKQKEQKDFLFLIALYFLCHSLYLIAKKCARD